MDVHEQHKGLPVLTFAGPSEWGGWLADNGAAEPGCWLLHAKKGSGLTTVTYPEAVEESLRHGWIDGLGNSRDAATYLVRYSPRKPRSVWSQVNQDKVAQLVAEQRMLPTGLAAVERARVNGQWDRAYAPPSRITVPDDLRAALDAVPAAAAAFAALSGTDRYAVLYRVQDAKRADTRARRIAALVEQLAAA